jgi:hypothetical protein
VFYAFFGIPVPPAFGDWFQRWFVTAWCLLLASAVGVDYLLGRWRSRTGGGKWPLGFCQSCGYDLRATPDRCPECGRLARSAADSSD